MGEQMKLKIAAGTLGLAALLVVPGTQAHAALTPRQCQAIQATINALDVSIRSWPADAPQSGLNKLERQRTRLENKFVNGGCTTPP
jgi:hypothetical protein